LVERGTTAPSPFESAAQAFASLLSESLIQALEPVLNRLSGQELVGRVDLPPVLSVDEAAQYLGVGRNAVYEAVRSGEIPSLRIGRRIRIPTQALLKKLAL
jgi:excisionase family DNA binding protein